MFFDVAESKKRKLTYKCSILACNLPMVCQICGKPGHIERLCPKARRMGFLDREKEREKRE
jgi:hypothetical protein